MAKSKENNMKPSPLPWKYEFKTGVIRHRFNVPMSRENVEYAAMCVNSHAALVEAAAKALHDMDDGRIKWTHKEVCAKLRAALALAEKP